MQIPDDIARKYILEIDGKDEMCEFTWDSTDFHLVPFPDLHLDHMINCWGQRSRAYKETWLVLYEDQSNIEAVVKILSDKNAVMDYDDDFVSNFPDLLTKYFNYETNF